MRVENEKTNRPVLTLLSCAALTLVSGCFETRQLPAVVPTVDAETEGMIGPEGGSLAIDDLLVTIPPGAVDAGTLIHVSVEAPPTGGQFTAFSPIITLTPAGLVLAEPLEIRIPYRGADGRIASVFTTQAGGGAYVPLTTQISGDVAIAHMDYLASTFVGSACEGDDCSCEPNGMLDLLVVIDDSNSMSEEQEQIRLQLPLLFEALATGNLDGDPSTQEVAAFGSIRVGITTTNMGSGASTGVATCEPGLGNDGILLSDRGAGADASCTTPDYGAQFAEYSSGMPAGRDAFVAQLSCVGARGIGGCGFEQQLEAALTALSPNAPTGYTAPGWTVPMYADGRMGQGDGENSGFLRDGSILAILWVTDEEDCSTTNSALFDPAHPDYAGVDLNLRCFTFPGQLQPVQRFVDGIVGLRRRPEDVVVAAVTGTPTDFVATPGAIDYDALLGDRAMLERIELGMNRLMPSCTSPIGRGIAFPPRRIVETLRGVDEAGGRVVLQSICDEDFGGLTRDLATELGERASGGC